MGSWQACLIIEVEKWQKLVQLLRICTSCDMELEASKPYFRSPGVWEVRWREVTGLSRGHLQLFSRRSNGWQSTMSTSYLTPNSRSTFGDPTLGSTGLTGSRPRRQDMAWHSVDRCFAMSSLEDLHALVLSDVKSLYVSSLANETWLCSSVRFLSRWSCVRLVLYTQGLYGKP